MAQFKRISRTEAIDFLNSSENWRDLRRGNNRIAAPDDMATSTLRRYANALRRIEASGGWVHDLSEIRGHVATEHHKGRGRKAGFEHYERPEKVRRMFWEELRFSGLDRRGHRVRAEARFTVTAGESVALRAVKMAARAGMSVQLVLTGPLPGQQAELFTKGGYNADLLLLAAGYRPGKRGAWGLDRSKGPGLEAWLINYMVSLPRYTQPEDKWPFIALYQIYARDQINEVDTVAIGHQRTYYLPLGERMTAYRRP